MKAKRITLKEALNFHGHLGPYLILGILAGELAIKKLGCKKYFGLDVLVRGANKKPKSCLIDGLQLSTGATYGKGNIQKFNGWLINVEFHNKLNDKRLNIKFKNYLLKELKAARTHKDSEVLARKLYKANCSKLFDLSPTNYELRTKN